MHNQFTRLLDKYPELYDHDIHGFSFMNPNMTFQVFKNFIKDKKLYNSFELSKHKCITWDIIMENFNDYIWDWEGISCNPNITLDIIEQNEQYDWTIFSSLRNGGIVNNPNLTWKFINDNIDIISRHSRSAVWYYISKHKCVDWNIIKNNLCEYDWCWEGISENPNITWDIVKNNMEKFKSNMSVLSKHPCITLDIIEKNIDLFDWSYIALNPHLTFSFIMKHFDKFYKEYYEKSNKSIWFDMIEQAVQLTRKEIDEIINRIIVKSDYSFTSDHFCYNMLLCLLDVHPNIEKEIDIEMVLKNKNSSSYDFENIYINKYDYNPCFFDYRYNQIKASKKLDVYREELIKKSWNPFRKNYIQWCFDTEECDFIINQSFLQDSMSRMKI